MTCRCRRSRVFSLARDLNWETKLLMKNNPRILPIAANSKKGIPIRENSRNSRMKMFLSLLVQHLGEMDGFCGLALTRQQTLDVHQAARIAGDDIFRAGLGGGGAFHFAHRGGNHRKLRGEGSAEAAAGFLFHLDELQPADFAKQRARRGFDAEFTQAVTAVVERDLVREFCAEIGDTKFADEEIGKLPRPRGDFFGEFSLWRFGEKLGIKVFHHRAAGAGTDNRSEESRV